MKLSDGEVGSNGTVNCGLTATVHQHSSKTEVMLPTQTTIGAGSVVETIALLTHLWDNIESSRASMEEHAAVLGRETMNALKQVCQTMKEKPLARAALDIKRLDMIPSIVLPPYERRKPLEKLAWFLSLPLIEASHLSDALFTHLSTHTAAEASLDALTYERLEFLGDAYLEIIASRLIYSRFTYLNTGQQSTLRQLIINNQTLSKFALQYGFDKRIKTSYKQDFESGKRTKILADMFEAYVAAVILSSPDTGFATAEAWMTELWAEMLLEQREEKFCTEAKQELAKKILTNIEYLEECPSEFNGQTGNHDFHVGVYFTGWGLVRERLGVGKAGNKTHAGMRAAADAVESSADLIEELVRKRDPWLAAKRAGNDSK